MEDDVAAIGVSSDDVTVGRLHGKFGPIIRPTDDLQQPTTRLDEFEVDFCKGVLASGSIFIKERVFFRWFHWILGHYFSFLHSLWFRFAFNQPKKAVANLDC